MDIYKVYVEHFSQKDSHVAIETFLLATSVEDVYKWVDEKQCGLYTERDSDYGMCDVYDKDYNVVGQESFKDKMLRLGGEFFDGDYEPQDLYYGCTIYGWEKVESVVTEIEITALQKLGLLHIV